MHIFAKIEPTKKWKTREKFEAGKQIDEQYLQRENQKPYKTLK